MIDLGFQIPQIGQYIMYILGGILILTGVIFAIVSLVRGKKNDITKESKEENTKRRRKRSDKY